MNLVIATVAGLIVGAASTFMFYTREIAVGKAIVNYVDTRAGSIAGATEHVITSVEDHFKRLV